ncbi:DUF2804 domain-containing protein [Vibrio sp. SCSIO 43136]|uniref:DUF2804 domain-containing protein n=1 Tax=Vibrio sp. SCSIO 43136 TaxID=2819101 RepID=UPI002075EB26|nr:DUF2804 domain-containing protein [Vibrio sp. SCSIO 43136]USD64450.1 DUF2804 domain-containing protein [Vibrio sp. SCSIO 43136]
MEDEALPFLSVINQRGEPVFGQFDQIPQTLGIEKFCYQTSMDKSAGPWARYFGYKQFQFVSLVTPQYVVGVAIADIRYLTSTFCYVYDRNTHELSEQKWLRPLGLGSRSQPSPLNGIATNASGQVSFQITNGQWQLCINSKRITANLTLHPLQTSLPLAMCSPTGYNGWTYTQKHNALSVKGDLVIDGQPQPSGELLAGYDFSAGYMRRETSWRWASINAQVQGKKIGLNLAAGVNETGMTENVLWVDGVRHYLGPVQFEFDRHDLDKPWQITSKDGRVQLTFTASNLRSEKLNLWLLKSNFRQFIGHFDGVLQDGEGNTYHLKQVLGLTEDHFARW